MLYEQLTHDIIGHAMIVHGALGPGFLESVYRNALEFELQNGGHSVEHERKLEVRYRERVVGTFCADLIVNGVVLVEAKAVHAIVPPHEMQVINYLKATGLDVGLLINFGAESLEVRRKSRQYIPSKSIL